MFWFIIFCILALLTVVYAIATRFVEVGDGYGGDKHKLPFAGTFIGVILSALVLIPAVTYTQDVGEAKVMKNMTGEIVGVDTDEGLGFKAPWVDAVDYDIRNLTAAHIGDGTAEIDGKKVDDTFITVRDAKGVASDYDVIVRYGIREDRAQAVYENYGAQDAFKARLINPDVRSVVRNVPASYTTIDMLNNRANIEKEIFDALVTKWEKEGVQVNSVALQEIRPPADVSQSFADAQNAQTQVVQAQAELDRTKISAQQKVVQAQAEAEANNVLAASLTPTILQQRFLDKFGELAAAGNVVMVPADGGNSFNIIPKTD